MRKGLIFLLGIVSLLGINTVRADTNIVLSHYYSNFENYIEDYNQYKENIDHLINYWEEHYSNNYPYYALVETLNGAYVDSTGPTFSLLCSNSNEVFYNNVSFTFSSIITLEYDSTKNTYNYNSTMSPELLGLNVDSDYYYERQTLISHGLKFNADSTFLIPTYRLDSLNLIIEEIKLKKGINYPGLIDLKTGTYDYNINDIPELEFDDMISNPLNALTDIKDTIVSIFDMISDFISLLPEQMQKFLILSFIVAVSIGLIKLIL